MTREPIVVRATKLFFLVCLCLPFAPAGWSQLTTSATLNGTVTDSAGGVVPQAGITVINEDTNVESHTVSNGDGSFVVPGLVPGHYKVTIAKDQFQTYTETGIILDTAQVATVNAALTVGQVATSVTVQSSAVQVQTTTAEVSNEVEEQQVETLPLNGRNYQSLSYLMPGVTSLAPDTAEGGSTYGTAISANGQGSSGMMFYLDGIWNSNTSSLSGTKYTPNPDTIQEVRLLQNNYGAEYSLNGSTVLLVQTKSGTSSFHGNAFEYFRNDALNTHNYFNPVVTPLKQSIFGYTLGGPVYIPHHYNTEKNKTFFFVNQQWTIQHAGGASRVSVPTAAELGGLFPSGEPVYEPGVTPKTQFPGNQIPVGMLNASALAILAATVPAPNVTPLAANANTQLGNYINPYPSINHQPDREFKVDQIIGPKLRLMFEYLHTHQITTAPNQAQVSIPFPETKQKAYYPSNMAQLRLTQLLSSSMVNNTSISFDETRNGESTSGIESQSQVPGFGPEVLPFPITQVLGRPANPIPYIQITQGGYGNLGYGYIYPVYRFSTLEDTISDDWSWLRGKHFIKAGMQYVRGHQRRTAFTPTGGIWQFNGSNTTNGLADFLLGDASIAEQANTALRGHENYPIASPYIEDQWKIRRNLTLTFGLRYAYSPNPSYDASAAGVYSNFIPSLYNPADAPIVNSNGTLTTTANYNPTNGIALLGTAAAPLNYTNKYKNYWDPSFGFAYDIFGNGKTSLRGGYGVTHTQTLPFACGPGNCLTNPPAIITSILTNPGGHDGFPNSLGGQPRPATPSAFTGESANFRGPKYQTFSLDLEQQLKGWIVSVAGAGEVANALPRTLNINQPVPEGGFNYNPLITTASSGLTYSSGIAGPAPYLGYSGISYLSSGGYTNWYALEVNVKHPVGHNVFFTAAYTWQHGLTTNGPQDSYHPNANYGDSSTNVAQILTLSGIWNIPLFSHSNGFKGALLGGWKYSDITTLQAGFDLTPTIGTSTPGLSTYANRVAGTSVAGPKTVGEWFNTAAFAVPTLGYFGNATSGSILGPGVIDFDMALYKDFKIKEQNALQFRAEFFNIFNHTNFSGVSTAVGSGNYGQVTSALDPRIMEMVLRYQF